MVKNVLLLTGLAMVAGASLVSCRVDADLPKVETLSIDSCTSASAYLSGIVLADGGDPVVRRGFCVSIDSTIPPMITSAGGNSYWITCGNGLGNFATKVKAKWTGQNLSVRHVHYIRAYATNGAGTGYGKTLRFNPKSKPLIKDAVLLKSPVVEGTVVIVTYKILPTGCYVKEFTLCYDTQPNPTIEKTTLAIANPLEEKPIRIAALTPNTAYYFRILMKNEDGDALYTNEVSCSTGTP